MNNFLNILAFQLLARFGSTAQACTSAKLSKPLFFSKHSIRTFETLGRLHYFISNHWYKMTSMFNRYLYGCALLIVVAAFSSCSRPVAYFQRTPVNLLTTLNTQPISGSPLNQVITSPIRPDMKANTTISQLEFVARDNNKLALTKTLSKHTDRVKTWLVSTHETIKPPGNYTVGGMRTVERGIVKKDSETKRGQFIPSVTKKARANWIKLIGGIILLVVGGTIMLAGPGSIFFLGLVVALFGFVGVIVGLFAE